MPPCAPEAARQAVLPFSPAGGLEDTAWTHGQGGVHMLASCPQTWGDSNLGIGCRTPGKPRILHLNLAFQVIAKVCLSREESLVFLQSLLPQRITLTM